MLGSHETTPLVVKHQGRVVLRLNTDGTVEVDWASIEVMRDQWASGCTDHSVILAKTIWEIAERVRAETESEFVAHH